MTTWTKIIGPDNLVIHVTDMGKVYERSIVECKNGLFDLYIGDVACPISTHETLEGAMRAADA